MSHKIYETEKMIYDAYAVSPEHVNDIADKLADICGKAQEGAHPVGFIAKKIQQSFDKRDLEIIASMFMTRVINEENSKLCECDECKAERGEALSEEDFIKKALKEQFPGMEVVKLPNNNKGKTDC